MRDRYFRYKYLKYREKYQNIIGGAHLPIKPVCRNNDNENKTIIIKSHGAMTGRTFKIPKNVKVIQIVTIGSAIPFVNSNSNPEYNLESDLDDIYRFGNSLFTENDTTHNLSEDGDDFMAKYGSTSCYGKINKSVFTVDLQNHIGNESWSERDNGYEIN